MRSLRPAPRPRSSRPRRRGSAASTPALAWLGVVSLVLAACGTSAVSAQTGAAAPRGPARAGATTGPAAGATKAGLDLAELGSLTDYAGTMTDNGATISVEVHSATDWSESTGGTPMLHIGGVVYVKTVSPTGQPAWAHTPDPASAYQQSPYPGAVGQFSGFTKVADATVTKGAACAAAGVPGHTWTIASPHTSVLSERESACVADASGALLSLTTGANGTAVPASGFAYSFTITQVGGVPAIAVPSPLLAG